MALTTYSIVDFTVARAGLEGATYGSAPGTLEVIPVYNATEPLVSHQQGSDPLELANSQLGPSGFYVTEPTCRFSATTYVYCSDPSAPPPWAGILLPISGFKKSAVTGTAPTETITPTTSSGGKLAAGTYKYVFSKVDVDPTAATFKDETPASASTSVTVATAGSKVTLTFSAGAGANKVWRVYRTKVGQNAPYYFVGDTDPNSTTFVDNIPDGELDVSRTAYTSAFSGTIFTPRSEHFDSAYIEVFMHSHKRPVAGARGTWTLDAEAGRAMPMRWDITGLYVPASPASNPYIGQLNPGVPFIFRNAVCELTLTTRGTTGSASTIAPFVVKSISLTPGTPTDNRRDASTATGISEIGIHRRFDARLQITFEVDRNFGFDAVEAYNQMRLFSGKITVGSSPKIEFSFPNLQIMEAPGLTSQDGGILSWQVAFRPLPLASNDFMQIRLLQ